ncbi:hypothetical protein A3I18_00130 [Candidatus Campbellbacteria bacterium RIFCSPLOWO2_02_FULL_35_11]|uniref:Sodium/calcium exchanger membrane region domain-containing protein n=2 Tax=Candidatus Campbelliibacteriota TaxID=1752727 RepID=A0A1F5EKN8_9BACT|nr:MAG: hypothetical protein A3E89_01050 [Candidatus Campbellbacteria bacterium RIFCSPHIGHO2_12_FULL_35_10]OGD70047.1 MAG: hypothetical protein A3I18_00130 [Candidatus Campbellbacteria bacterium RIFCSPLOWO2_02_FULL_35_11]
MINNLFIFATSLFLVIRGATMATKHAEIIAENYHLSKYIVGFIIVAIVSILPETFIAINSAIQGIPAFGLGTLFGGNIADLTLIFAILVLFEKRSLKIESKIFKNHRVYPSLLFLPIILGFNGHFSRLEGIILIIAGVVFYYLSLKGEVDGKKESLNKKDKYKSIFMLLFSMTILLVGSHFTVTSATHIANLIGISPIFIGMLVVGLGTTIPELVFSLKSVRKNNDSLAVGDILGTVLADATIVVGIIALINPFFFPQRIIYVTGLFMVAASFMLFNFMNTGEKITKKEAYMLFVFWLLFVFVEFIVSV